MSRIILGKAGGKNVSIELDVLLRRVRRVELPEDALHLKAGTRRMLTILAQWHPDPLSRDQLGILAGFAPTGGTFNDYLSTLRRAAFVAEYGEQLRIIEEGLAYIGTVAARPESSEELIALWKSKFKAGVGRMLDALVEAYPEWLSREELGERAGFAAAGGTFSDYLSQLRRARLIEEQAGQVRAHQALMEL